MFFSKKSAKISKKFGKFEGVKQRVIQKCAKFVISNIKRKKNSSKEYKIVTFAELYISTYCGHCVQKGKHS